MEEGSMKKSLSTSRKPGQTKVFLYKDKGELPIYYEISEMQIRAY